MPACRQPHVLHRVGIAITATEADRKFSQILREVRRGKTCVVTSRGEAVACIGPPQAEMEPSRQQRDAFESLMRQVRRQPVKHIAFVAGYGCVKLFCRTIRVLK